MNKNYLKESFLSDFGKALAFVYFGMFLVLILTSSGGNAVLSSAFAIVIFALAPIISLKVVFHPLPALIIAVGVGILVKTKMVGRARRIAIILLMALWEFYGWNCLIMYIGGA